MHELHNFAMLTGAALLAKVKELGDASKSDLVRACGYVSTKKDGSERLNFTAFYEALLNAKGLDFSGSPGPQRRTQAELQHQDSVQRQPHGRQGLHSHARHQAR